VRIDQALLGALAHERPQLVLGHRSMAGLASGRYSERFEQQVAEPVEEVDDRPGEQVERAHWSRHRERSRLRACDGKALRRELSDNDVEEGDDRERHRAGERDAQDPRGLAEDGLEQMGERALADDPDAEARDRDPELAGGQVGVDVVDGVPDRARTGLAITLEVVDLGRSHAGDRELGGDEERVPGDEHDRQGELKDQRVSSRRLCGVDRAAFEKRMPCSGAVFSLSQGVKSNG
jgi:hypothetical protein